MTDTKPITSAPLEGTHEHYCEPKLRRVLRLNAASCLVSGTALAVAAGPIDDLLDTGHPGWVRLVGLGLLPFAALCWWVAAGPLQRLRGVTPWIIAGDVTWVTASVATVLLGWYSGGGIVAVLTMAVAVDVFAVLQFMGWRKLRPRRSTH
jgi:hypothetical protein